MRLDYQVQGERTGQRGQKVALGPLVRLDPLGQSERRYGLLIWDMTDLNYQTLSNFGFKCVIPG